MLLFTLLVTAILSLLTGSVYYFAQLERQQVFEKRLKSRATYNTQPYAIMGVSGLHLLRRIDSVALIGATVSRSIGMYTDDGKVLYKFEMPGTKPLAVSKSILGEVRQKGEKAFTMDNREAVAIHRNAGKRDFIVVVAGRYDDRNEKRGRNNKKLLLLLLLLLLLSVLSYFLSPPQPIYT